MEFLMSNFYFTFALIVIGFGFLIFVHELGHFLVAKMVGIKTTQFAIGFGHSLLTWRKGMGFRVGTTEPEYEKLLAEGADPATLGETEYRLNYIPLGGYVKMLGQEDMDPSARSEDPRAFNNKSVSARFAVISAGVIMNLIFGMIFFVIAFMSGVMFPPAIVGSVMPDSPASRVYAEGHDNDPAYLGLQPDDHITHVDGVETGDMLDIKYATILASEDTPLNMTVKRPGEPTDLTYRVLPEMQPIPGTDDTTGLKWIGIEPPTSLETGPVEEGSPAYEAGIREDMFITAVDGAMVDTFRQYETAIGASAERDVTITFTDYDEEKAQSIDLRVTKRPLLLGHYGEPKHLLGLVPPVEIIEASPKGPSAKAGFKTGDVVTSINGIAWPDFATFQKTIKEADRQPVSITVLREGKEVTIEPVTPSKQGVIGVAVQAATGVPVVCHTLPDSPASSANIIRGSRLKSINGISVDSWADLQEQLEAIESTDGPASVALEYELNLANNPIEKANVSVSPDALEQIADAGWEAPLPVGLTLRRLQVPVVGDDPLEATALGFTKTHQFITQTYTLLTRLFQRTVPPDVVSGPVGIVHQGTIIAERGWQYLLYFLGLISINLAVINFLPIPITDGGQAVFLVIEKIKGSPVSVKVQTVATLAGLALLACVFLFVTYNDITRLLS